MAVKSILHRVFVFFTAIFCVVSFVAVSGGISVANTASPSDDSVFILASDKQVDNGGDKDVNDTEESYDKGGDKDVDDTEESYDEGGPDDKANSYETYENLTDKERNECFEKEDECAAHCIKNGEVGHSFTCKPVAKCECR